MARTRIVRVRAVTDRFDLEVAGSLEHLAESHRPAVIAAIVVVFDERVALEFGEGDDLVADADLACDPLGVLEFGRRKRLALLRCRRRRPRRARRGRARPPRSSRPRQRRPRGPRFGLRGRCGRPRVSSRPKSLPVVRTERAKARCRRFADIASIGRRRPRGRAVSGASHGPLQSSARRTVKVASVVPRLSRPLWLSPTTCNGCAHSPRRKGTPATSTSTRARNTSPTRWPAGSRAGSLRR